MGYSVIIEPENVEFYESMKEQLSEFKKGTSAGIASYEMTVRSSKENLRTCYISLLSPGRTYKKIFTEGANLLLRERADFNKPESCKRLIIIDKETNLKDLLAPLVDSF